jgi:uncharacterized OsmC-like protein
MPMQEIAAAIERVKSVLRRRPEMGLHDDSPATARWERDMRVVASHANGTRLSTDMPGELGGTGDLITPGWLFRAGFASCAATSIAMTAVAQGIELTSLEVRASSRSDTRGLIGMNDASGVPVFAGPSEVRLEVRISADGVPPERLRELVQNGYRCSPVPNAVTCVVPVDVHIEVEMA